MAKSGWLNIGEIQQRGFCCINMSELNLTLFHIQTVSGFLLIDNSATTE